jgi:HEPN domain-containing protein
MLSSVWRKALKALLIRHHIAFPRTHVIETLLDLLKAAGVDVPLDVDEAFILTQYALRPDTPATGSPLVPQKRWRPSRKQKKCWAG